MKKILSTISIIFLFAGLMAQTIAAPYSQNFDTMTVAQPPSQGWSAYISGTGSQVLTTGGVNAYSAPNFVRIGASSGTSILISPEITNLADSKATFWCRIAQAAPFPALIVGMMTDNQDPDTFYPIQTINTLNQTYQFFEVVLTDYADYGPYLAFKHGNVSPAKNILIDNFTLDIMATEPIFAINPASHDFGMIGVDYQSPVQTFVISNAGIGTLQINDIQLNGDDAIEYQITDQPASYPQSLEEGESFGISMRLSPQSAGTKLAQIVITHDQDPQPVEVPLTGEGFIRPAGSSCQDPIPLDLPATNYGIDISTEYGNDYLSGWISPGSSYLNGNDVVFSFTLDEESYLSGGVAGTGSRSAIFILSQCPDPLVPAVVLAKAEGINGGNFVDVPLAAGDYYAIISSTLSSSPIPITVNLSHEAAGPATIEVSPTQINFDTTVIGFTRQQNISLSNPGGTGLEIMEISLSGADASEFSLLDLPAGFPYAIDFAQNYQFQVTFNPTSIGEKTAYVEVYTNIGDPQIIQIQAEAVKHFESGSGSEISPFTITNLAQFNNLREYLGATFTDMYFKLESDIDLTGQNWLPIGTYTNQFYGNLDGNGFTINNLNIDATTTDYVGLFAVINTSEVRNLKIEQALVKGKNFTGILAGMALTSSIYNCYANGEVRGQNTVGGMLGQSMNTYVASSSATADVYAINSLGGLIGSQSNTSNPAVINSFATGKVEQVMAGTLAGGLIGSVFSGSVQNCYSIGAVIGMGNSSATWGGLIGNSLGAVVNSYYNTETSGRSDSNRGYPRTTLQMTYPYDPTSYVGWDFDTVWAADQANLVNDGYPFLLSSGNQPVVLEAGVPTQVGGFNITTTGQAFIDPAVTSDEPILASLPNYDGLSNFTVLGLRGFGILDISVSVQAGTWYGVLYNGGTWIESSPALVTGPGTLVFLGVNFDAKGDVVLVLSDSISPTLPVELSSFNALPNASMQVKLSWVVQSETEHLGYNIMRASDNQLVNASRINPMLIDTGNVQGTQISYSYLDTETTAGFTYHYWLESVALSGNTVYYGPVMASLSNPGDGGDIPELPLTTMLHNAFPNPFNPSTNLRYDLRDASKVSIDIYNLKGQLIRSYSRVHDNPGSYTIVWDGKDKAGLSVSTGVYFYRMQTDSYSATKRMLMSK